FGVGLLEALPDDTLLALADPDDADGDGISGRVNRVLDPSGALVIGRFGWKANVATVEQQTAGAFHGDIGITSRLQPDQDCTDAQPQCRAAIDGGEPELDDQKLERVTFYTRTLAVPARRDVDDADISAGARVFDELGCSSCHRPQLSTGDAEVGATANQTIHPYTDLLLHDMGPALADDRPDGEATGSEWRTAPLWGIGLIDDVNDHTRLLHDGRARDVEEAILWHGGEAAAAQGRFRQLDAAARDQLLRFVDSL
ncbi:MAG TPA: di-heme oxidoredictase family protein, partial [Ilumatobacteraceae bacterium]|nr:di-heme oxidoredictase family protein [Ilumatobacteraceae bacterium]